MNQNEDIQISETMADYLVQKLTDEKNGVAYAIEYLKSSFLAAAVQDLFYARRNANLTQEQLAQKLGKKQEAIARWEADVEGKMSLRQFVELAIGCGVIPLQMKLEPIRAVRDYLIDNPQSEWTQELYSSWQKKKVKPLKIAQSNASDAFTLTPTANRADVYLKQQREQDLEPWHSTTTSGLSEHVTNTNAASTHASRTPVLVQPTA